MADSRPDFHASLLHRYIQAAWDDTGLEMIQMFYQFCHLENGNWIARDDVRELQEMHKARISDVAKNTSLKMMPTQKDRQWGPHPFGPSGAYFVAQNMTTKLKPSIIYLSIGYWGIPLSVKRINLSSKPKDSVFTRFPVELHLEILEKHLPIHDADEAIRQVLPRLTPIWLRSIPRLFQQWFDRLTSRDNMRYLGTIEDRNETIETYRLRSLDLHPDIEIVSHTGYRRLRHNPLPERAPSLETAQVNLMARLMLLFIEYIMTKRENMKASSIGKEEPREVTTQEQESDCPTCTGEDVQNMRFGRLEI